MAKGQISAEMLIVLVLILGLVFIIYSQLSSNVKTLSKSTEEKTQKIVNMTNPNPANIVCQIDADCTAIDPSWTCDTTTNTCQA
ncbi:MAG: hypothetical protein N3D10_01735 [Candidatus Micrarchaeota archaeon]|nr:hypothetical protein [Candidatus Micrarchaeota archaeon]